MRLHAPPTSSVYLITPTDRHRGKASEMVATGRWTPTSFTSSPSIPRFSAARSACSSTAAARSRRPRARARSIWPSCSPTCRAAVFPSSPMNADRADGVPWNIYGDQRVTHRTARPRLDPVVCERRTRGTLDLALMAFRIAEDERVQTPFMINPTDLPLTHTYEIVDVPRIRSSCRRVSPPYQTPRTSLTSRPREHRVYRRPLPTNDVIFKFNEHVHMMKRKLDVLPEGRRRLCAHFGAPPHRSVRSRHT